MDKIAFHSGLPKRPHKKRGRARRRSRLLVPTLAALLGLTTQSLEFWPGQVGTRLPLGPTTALANTFLPTQPRDNLASAPAGTALDSVSSTMTGAASKARVQVTSANLPLSFVENRGQTDPAVKFLSRGAGYTLFLTPTEAVLSLGYQTGNGETEKRGNREGRTEIGTETEKTANQGDSRPADSVTQSQVPSTQHLLALRMHLVNANPKAQVQGQDELPGKINYFVGNDARKWQTDVPIYARVRYHDVYPGVDLVYYGNQRQLEHDFLVAPGVDPKTIRLSFTGVDKIEVGPEGDLVLHTAAGRIRQLKPHIYQEVDGVRQAVPGGYVVRGSQHSELTTDNRQLTTPEVGFEVAAYDVSKPLVIDPVLLYSTYLGGSSDEEAKGVGVDSAGNILVTGRTQSLNFPVATSVDPTLNGFFDVFVTKVSADGETLLYSTYLGGSGFEEADAIAVDDDGNAYITGTTGSSGFPITPGAFQTQSRGAPDAFVTKIDPQGRIVYSTFLGGPSPTNTVFTGEEGLGIAVDPTGNAYVTGFTASLTFPITPTAFQASGGSGGGPRLPFDNFDAFFSVLNADGTAVLYSSYLAGNGIDYGDGVAIDLEGNALVTGKTLSANFPTRNAFQPTYGGTGRDVSRGSTGDAFIVKIDPFQARNASLIYSSYLGGDRIDTGFAVAVDDAGNAYVTGRTDTGQDQAIKFPTTEDAFRRAETSPSSSYNFVTKVDPTGALVYSTLTGEITGDPGVNNGVTAFHVVRGGIAVDPLGNAWLTGAGTCRFPQVNPLQPSFGGFAYDVFVAQLDATGSALLFSTFLGGNALEHSEGLVLDADGNVYVAGYVTSPNFPITPNAVQPGKGDNNLSLADAFVAKISPAPQVSADLRLTTADAPDPVLVGRNLTYTLTATNLGPNDATDVRLIDPLPAGVTLVSASVGCTGASTITCNLGALASGASTTVTLVVTSSTGGQLSNMARVFGNEFDPVPNNNMATAVTTVDASTDLALSLAASPDPLTSTPDPVTSSRQNLTYTLTVTNNGPSPAAGVTVTDTLPANVAFFNASGGCRPASSAVTCTVPGTLAPGASASVVIVVKPIATGQIRNTASVSGSQIDPNLTNNTATAVTANQVIFADLGLTLTASPVSVQVGQRITYTVTVMNNGPMDAPGVIVTEAGFAPGNNFVSATSTQGTCSGTVMATCNIGALLKGMSATVKIIRTPTLAGGVSEAISVRAAVHDLNPTTDSAVAVTTVN